MSKQPKRGTVYTVEQIDNELALRDSPFLRFWLTTEDGQRHLIPMQTSHIAANISTLSPEWAAAPFEFQTETDEWIPLFRFAGTPEQQAALIDWHEVSEEKRLFRNEREFTVTPKGHPWDE
jgi:hypothetical protein